jgi:prophage antirepressor-like protein
MINLLIDGNPWFVLADICRVLEIGNPTMAAGRLDDDNKCLLLQKKSRYSIY